MFRSLPPPFLGRAAEFQKLHEALKRRESLLILGPAGIGKTALAMKVLNSLPSPLARSAIYLSGADGLQPLLRSLLSRLYEAGDMTLRRQLRAEGIRKGTFQPWLKSLSTSRLRGSLYRSAEMGRYCIVLDHMQPLTHAVAKVVRELIQMRNAPVYLLARGLSEAEIGHVTDLYWSDRQRLSLGPLSKDPAHQLLEWCVQRFGLARLNLTGFREQVLQLSGQIPGALIMMCALAAEPRYHYGAQIKTKLIRIDSLVRGYDPLPSLKLAEGADDRR